MRCHHCHKPRAFHVLPCPEGTSQHLVWLHKDPCFLSFASLYFRNPGRVRDGLPCERGCLWPGWVLRKLLTQSLESALEVHPHFQGLLEGHPWWEAGSVLEEWQLQEKRDQEWSELILHLARRLPSLADLLRRYKQEHPDTVAVIK